MLDMIDSLDVQSDTGCNGIQFPLHTITWKCTIILYWLVL